MHKYIRHPEKGVETREELVGKLQLQLDNFKLPKNSNVLLTKLKNLDQTLELIDEEVDPAIYAMVGGYVKEFVTYFLIAYYGTRDIEKSLEAYNLVKSLTKYIALLDKHYDEKTYDHKIRADMIFNQIMEQTQGYVKHGIIHNMSTLWATATYEIRLRQRMLKEEVFDKKEIRYHIMAKSSDTVLYSVVFDKYVENFSPNVMQLIHYNQAIMDIQDDFNDLGEDIMRRDLNTFVMATRGEIPISDIFAGRAKPKEILKESFPLVNGIISELETDAIGTQVPSQYAFLKSLSKMYVKGLRESIKKFK